MVCGSFRQKIETPYIKEQISKNGETLKDAFILWADSPELIDNVTLEDNGDYINFHVGRHTIAQGNAVIALRSDKNNIVWSWHIWVTEKDWSEKRITTTDALGNTYVLAPDHSWLLQRTRKITQKEHKGEIRI